MATTATIHSTTPDLAHLSATGQAAARLVVCAALPLGAFALTSLLLGSFGLVPAFFAPLGLSNGAGAIIHLSQIALLGAVFWALTEQDSPSTARFWIVGLVGLYIVAPYVAAWLSPLALCFACTVLFLAALATTIRVAAASRLAGALMLPILAISGFSAVLGLTLGAAFAPPFALMQSSQA